MGTQNQSLHYQLAQILSDNYSLAEQEALCFELDSQYEDVNIYFENVNVGIRKNTAINIVTHFARMEQIEILAEKIAIDRPYFSDEIKFLLALKTSDANEIDLNKLFGGDKSDEHEFEEPKRKIPLKIIANSIGVVLTVGVGIILLNGMDMGATGSPPTSTSAVVQVTSEVPAMNEAESEEVAKPTPSIEQVDTAPKDTDEDESLLISIEPVPEEGDAEPALGEEAVELMPEPTRDEIIQIFSTNSDHWIYAGPDTINMRLGAMQRNEKGIVLGKDKWEIWVKVETERGVTGWVTLDNVEFMIGTLEEVPVAWPTSSSDVVITNPGSSDSNSDNCIEVKIASQDWPSKAFDDIWIEWSNVPASGEKIRVDVTGNVNGKDMPLIYPTISEVDEGQYYIGYWKFIERDFSTNTRFTYTLQVLNENNDDLCTTSGTFDQ